MESQNHADVSLYQGTFHAGVATNVRETDVITMSEGKNTDGKDDAFVSTSNRNLPIAGPPIFDNPFVDASHVRNWPTASDPGIGISSGISEEPGADSIKAVSPRGNSSSGTMQIGTSTSILNSSESAGQYKSISRLKMFSIKQKLRELKSLIPPPDAPEVSHTAVALQVILFFFGHSNHLWGLFCPRLLYFVQMSADYNSTWLL